MKDGDLMVETVLVSVDPYLFAMTKQRPDMHEHKPIQEAANIGRVIESRAAGFEKGDFVKSNVGWVDKAVLPAASARKLAYKSGDAVLLPEYLNALGSIGRTAFHGIAAVFEPMTGKEVALVTGAAGAVGSMVVQILKARGCFVVGVVGTKEKADIVKNELGADVVFNYKTDKITNKALSAAVPGGKIDLFFDNTGGEVFDAAIDVMNTFGRIAVCGQIANYSHLDKEITGPVFLHKLIYSRVKVQGIYAGDADGAKCDAEARRLIAAGKLKTRFTILHSFDNIPKAQVDMMNGENVGKMLVQLINEY